MQLTRPSYFEIHLTVNPIDSHEEVSFANCCTTLEAKPLLIALARGEHQQQPMLSKVVEADNTQKVFRHCQRLSESLQENGFTVNRLKVEVPAKDSGLFSGYNPAFEKYYEWHGKVNDERKEALQALCLSHRAHLSSNKLRKEKHTRFVTLREFENSDIFNERIEALSETLTAGAWVIDKQQAEYCIYDSNVSLDNGWLEI